jgi:hypothetical protein
MACHRGGVGLALQQLLHGQQAAAQAQQQGKQGGQQAQITM